MNKFNSRLDYDCCSKVVDFLLSSENDNLIIIDHEAQPVTMIRYNGHLFILSCREGNFVKIVSSEHKSTSYDVMQELGLILEQLLGNPTLYYDATYMEEGIEKTDSVLEWCLNCDIKDNYINNIINNPMSDNIRYTNVKLFGEKVKRKALFL